MSEHPYEGILLEMQTLSQKYALGKMARRKFEAELKALQEHFSSAIMAQRLEEERKRAFTQGFIAASILGLGLFFLATAIPWAVIRRIY
jgi:hypothetical protein